MDLIMGYIMSSGIYYLLKVIYCLMIWMFKTQCKLNSRKHFFTKLSSLRKVHLVICDFKLFRSSFYGTLFLFYLLC
ncbi:hypothetical protein CDAR_240181 [Caerostris darwini]|uniref:Uncharacterized protein n=1 Tax=Caerostris darwini TaxID=1538125 RepID=A0AAV4V3R5_9ARAC|nr:hypothetical protein CDAR_240181 [Caerostris darwini]